MDILDFPGSSSCIKEQSCSVMSRRGAELPCQKQPSVAGTPTVRSCCSTSELRTSGLTLAGFLKLFLESYEFPINVLNQLNS